MALSDSGVKDFEGKVAVVTGGSRDIDRDAVDELIEKGAIAVIGDTSEVFWSHWEMKLQTHIGRSTCFLNLLRFTAYSCRFFLKYRAAFIRTDVSIYSDNKALFQFAETEFGGADVSYIIDFFFFIFFL